MVSGMKVRDNVLSEPVATTLVVVPTYNEIENLERLASELLDCPGQSLLVVDDNSPDGTGILADRLAARSDGRVKVLHRPGKQGLGTAYLAGFREAITWNCEYVVQMDADYSHDPADVPRLVRAARDVDVAIGSRYVAGGSAVNWPRIRRTVSRGGSLYTQLILGLPISDPTSGFKCFRRQSLAELDLGEIRASGFGFQVEMNWLCHRRGLSLAEIPIRFVDRKLGHSKMSGQIFFEALWLVWQLRFNMSHSLKLRHSRS